MDLSQLVGQILHRDLSGLNPGVKTRGVVVNPGNTTTGTGNRILLSGEKDAVSLLSDCGFISGFLANPSTFRATDFGMMGLANSKERDWNDWIELLKEADSGFVLKSVKTPPKSELSTVAIVWKGPPAFNNN